MEPILEQIFNGRLQPCKTMIPKSEEYTELVDEFEAVSEHFSQQLKDISPELEQRFSDLIDTINLLRCMEAEALFAQSFSLGIKLLSETLFTAGISFPAHTP